MHRTPNIMSQKKLTMFIMMTFFCAWCPGGMLTNAAHATAQPASACFAITHQTHREGQTANDGKYEQCIKWPTSSPSSPTSTPRTLESRRCQGR